jgi:alpha,alpha-trehalose-phosphate synthase [UDP-forming]
MWDKGSLHELIEAKVKDYPMIVVANREPFMHIYEGGGETIACQRPASGMASALDPVMRASGGVWVGHGSGDADRAMVDEFDRVRVPPDDPSYTLRRVWLTKEEEEGFYHGLSNAGLWPLCHVTFTRPVFRPEHWEMYRRVNHLFGDAVLEEAGDRPAFVFIQDYHFALLPRYLKERNPNLIIAQFWHIPWPNRETFRVFPWKEELLDGLLGNDLLGFHLRYHCQNFVEAVDRTIEARIDQEQGEIVCGGKSTLVRPFPISIDFEHQQALAVSTEVEQEMTRMRRQLGRRGDIVGIGIERIDYTKGIPERFEALDRFFERYPEFREHLTFVQVGVPTRGHIAPYQQIEKEIDRLVEQLNWKWGTPRWRPVVYFKRHFSPVEMAALHRLANFCIVSSLHDGMNLVAKEFVASRPDEDGVLVLSQFAGSALELSDAVLFNPYAVDELADAIRQAVEMPQAERKKRMQRMRSAVQDNNVYRWAGKILSALLKFDMPDAPSPATPKIEMPANASVESAFSAAAACFDPATK